MKQGIARSRDAELAYTVAGDGPETVILLMGLGGRAADWGTPFPAALAKHYRVVQFDHRGVGESPKARGGYTMSDMAADAVSVLDAVGADRAHFVGVSMGGMISQVAAVEHSGRVDKLVLLSTHFGGRNVVPPTPAAMRLFDPGEFLERGRDPVSMMRFTMSVITAPGFLDTQTEMVEAILAAVQARPTHPGTFMAQVQAIMGSDRYEAISGIPHPTLVVHGTEDQLIPFPNGENLARRIPGSRFVRMENTGHMAMWERPSELAHIVLDFLRG